MRTKKAFTELNQYQNSPPLPEASTKDKRILPNLDVPRHGHVLSTAAEMYGKPLRQAVRILAKSMPPSPTALQWQRLGACRRVEPGAAYGRSETELGAWFVVAAWVVGVAANAISSDAKLLDAEAWFLGGIPGGGLASLASKEARTEAERVLHAVADASAFADLLPYILDPHGEGNRLSVRRRPETATARERKKADGVYYTPGDVAAFMAAETLRHLSDDAILLTVFDPACGSGVFLRAALTELLRRNPGTDEFDLACSCLYGTDIDPWAVSASGFVLLHACFSAVRARGIPPITAWHALRLNLAHLDALRLDPGKELCHNDPQRIARLECRSRLKAGELPVVSGQTQPEGPLPFHLVFSELAEGPCVIIGNPPYADIGENGNLLSLSMRYETLQAAPRPSSDVYPLFVEQMTRLTAPNAHGGAMVLPLSIACNTGRQFLALRSHLARTPGHWRFAFFDREPHALFGEDVKTRNAIVLWSRQSADATIQISTGPLRKWRGHSRARMLDSITFTPIDVDIRPGIPKIDGKSQTTALTHLHHETHTLRHAVTSIGRSTLDVALRRDETTVYVGATAYNFLNVFLRPPPWKNNADTALTENPLHALVCPTHAIALQVFALLSSRLAFWWWHAHGDGFHVSRHVIETIPVGPAMKDEGYAQRLSSLGKALWNQVALNPVVSLNRGRTSLGFTAVSYSERGLVDALLVEALGLGRPFANELEQFCDNVTTARVAHEIHQNHQRKESI